jgi:hypothetical protein
VGIEGDALLLSDIQTPSTRISVASSFVIHTDSDVLSTPTKPTAVLSILPLRPGLIHFDMNAQSYLILFNHGQTFLAFMHSLRVISTTLLDKLQYDD